MKPAVPAEAPPAVQRRPQKLMFRKRSNFPLPTRDQSRRQSNVVQSAWRHFGAPGPVIAFLNTRHDGLDAQPLHIAIESDEGLRRVEKLLEEMSLRT